MCLHFGSSLDAPLIDDFIPFLDTKLEEAHIGGVVDTRADAVPSLQALPVILQTFAKRTPLMRKIELAGVNEQWLAGMAPHWPLLQSLQLKEIDNWGATSSRQLMQFFPALRTFGLSLKGVHDHIPIRAGISQNLLRLPHLTNLTISYACQVFFIFLFLLLLICFCCTQTSLDELELPGLETLLLCFVEQWPVPLTLSPFLNSLAAMVTLHIEMADGYPLTPDMFGTVTFPALRVFQVNAGQMTSQLLACLLGGMPILEELMIMGASKDIGDTCGTTICTYVSVSAIDTLRTLGLALSANQASAFRAILNRLTALERIETYEGENPALVEVYDAATNENVVWYSSP